MKNEKSKAAKFKDGRDPTWPVGLYKRLKSYRFNRTVMGRTYYKNPEGHRSCRYDLSLPQTTARGGGAGRSHHRNSCNHR